jgi:PKD repeat protein
LSSAEIKSLDAVAHQSAMSVVTGEPVAFVNQTSGTLALYWDFGDGTISTEAAPVHHYSAPGVYTVRLTVQTATGWGSLVSEDLVTVH